MTKADADEQTGFMSNYRRIVVDIESAEETAIKEIRNLGRCSVQIWFGPFGHLDPRIVAASLA